MKSLSGIFSVGIIFLISLANTLEAQTGLGIQVYPGTNISGAIGSIYSIQATTNIAQPNSWTTVSVFQLLNKNYLWFDTSFPTNSQRFYRTVAFTTVLTNMVFIPAGTFLMGSPADEKERSPSTEAQHSVTISNGFFMEKFLVTQTNYSSFAGTNPSYFNDPTNFNNPVENMSWSSATNYCALRTALEQAARAIPTNWGYRLPTREESEYACRAGSTAAFYLGSHLYSGLANFNGTHEYDSGSGTNLNTNGVFLQITTPVGSYSANGWGLYDMIGNVWEWCSDLYTDTNGISGRVIRGGSYLSDGAACRSSARSAVKNGDGSRIVGFRVVLAPTQ